MKARSVIAVAIGIVVLTAWAPGHARLLDVLAAQDAQHEHQPAPAATPGTTARGPQGNMMMGNMMASDAKLDELVRKMNDAKGQAKTDAMAEVITALVQQHRAMCGMMAGQMGPMTGTPAQSGK